MLHEFSRMESLVGAEALKRLKNARVAVFGIGGVGSYVVEALARGGVGTLILCDNDEVSLTNINRQLVALHSTIGQKKVEVAAGRVKDICPDIRVELHPTFFPSEDPKEFDFTSYDYIVDAIDTVSSKLLLVEKAKEHGVPILSCMGTGNQLDPTKFVVTDLSKTSMCPLAKVMRVELRKRGIEHLKVVYSTEPAQKPQVLSEEVTAKRAVPGSVSFVPPVAGLIAAGEVLKDLMRGKDEVV